MLGNPSGLHLAERGLNGRPFCVGIDVYGLCGEEALFFGELSEVVLAKASK